MINKEQLEKYNDEIEAILEALDKDCETIQKMIDNAPQTAEEILQREIDKMEKVLQEKGDTIRGKLIGFLKPQLQWLKEKIKPVIVLYNLINNLSMDTILDAVKEIIKLLLGPYEPYVKMLTELPPELVRLSKNLKKLVNWRPKITPPEGIVVPIPEVDIKDITMADLEDETEEKE